MKTLKDHVIIYDDECPMCDLYTQAFIKTNMLDENGREPYSWITARNKNLIDKKRACNEIALINTKDGNVMYGIDSLFAILGHRFPTLKTVFANAIFKKAMRCVYSFISYNRKVIVPGNKFEGKNSCIPDYNLPYRWAYIIFAWLISSLILNSYSPLLPISPGTFYREFLICGGQILFQGAAVFMIRKERAVHYLGNMMTISLAGSLLLLPLMILPSLLWIAPYFYSLWFLVVVGLMLFEHHRRLKILNIHWALTASWIIYRSLILLIII